MSWGSNPLERCEVGRPGAPLELFGFFEDEQIAWSAIEVAAHLSNGFAWKLAQGVIDKTTHCVFRDTRRKRDGSGALALSCAALALSEQNGKIAFHNFHTSYCAVEIRYRQL